jgi:hypothetical protein
MPVDLQLAKNLFYLLKHSNHNGSIASEFEIIDTLRHYTHQFADTTA